MSDLAIDIHCHIFNADDLPVRGFVQHLHLDTPVLGPLLSTLIERIVQGQAPGYADDIARIQSLLGTGGPNPDLVALEALGRARQPGVSLEAATDLDAQTDAALARLMVEDPVFVRRLTAAVAAEASPAGVDGTVTAEGLADQIEGARRAVRWAKIFGMSRLDVAAELVRNFGDEVDLFCPLLVDLAMGLGEQPKTTVRQQVEMLEGISILSMRGRLPGGGKARMHPFVGFDPRRQALAPSGLPITPLSVVQSAVLEHGFVGVKLYPPMGWQPLGNTANKDMTADEAEQLDAVLRTFYAWCVENDVPVTAHANRSNYADPAFKDYAGPVGWGKVVHDFPDLHVNLGHFGGASAKTPKSGWPFSMAGMAAVDSHHVYADVADHRIDESAIATGYLDLLNEFFSTPTTASVTDRLMYGSDWFMLAINPDHEKFLTSYRALYKKRFGPVKTQKFMSQNALTFLGFDDAQNKNRQRLLAYYAKYAPANVPDWLT
jgi:predicted TIM-barrel fold metal-dependent hydrolase